MTDERAAEVLERTRRVISSVSPLYEASEVAIKRLREPVIHRMDCISRQAAIDYFVTNVGFHDEDGYPIEDECELREIWTGYFDGIPSAQPEPLKIDLSGYSEEDWERLKKEWRNTPITVLSAQPKTGKWISADAIFGGVPFYCSECGENTRDTVMGKPRWKFCPMCGSRNEVTE